MTEADRDLLRDVLAEVRLLRGELLRRRNIHADPAQDGRLMLALAQSAGDRVFAVADVLRHRRVDASLAAALEALMVRDARRLGAALKRLRGRPHAGLVLERIGRDERGALWTVAAVSGVRHTDPGSSSLLRAD